MPHAETFKILNLAHILRSTISLFASHVSQYSEYVPHRLNWFDRVLCGVETEVLHKTYLKVSIQSFKLLCITYQH